MRRIMVGVGFVVLFTAVGSSARAQVITGFSDPFSLYYGFYLPRQAALANTPRPEMTVNSMAALRQQAAITDRAGLYDPVQPFGANDPDHMFSDRSKGPGMSKSRNPHMGGANGNGPPMYYNRTSSYYSTMRSGRSTNGSIAAGGSPARRNYSAGAGSIASGKVSMPSMGGMGGIPR